MESNLYDCRMCSDLTSEDIESAPAECVTCFQMKCDECLDDTYGCVPCK